MKSHGPKSGECCPYHLVIYKALTPSLHYNLKARLRQRHSITLPLATQLEVGIYERLEVPLLR